MIVVTGGAGFIGSCIVAKLNTFGWDAITIVDHLENNDPKNENIKKKRYTQYLDKADFLKAVWTPEEDRCDMEVFHLLLLQRMKR